MKEMGKLEDDDLAMLMDTFAKADTKNHGFLRERDLKFILNKKSLDC